MTNHLKTVEPNPEVCISKNISDNGQCSPYCGLWFTLNHFDSSSVALC